MRNRADPSAVRTVYFDTWRDAQDEGSPVRHAPACGCGGEHHERDSAVVLTRLGYGIIGEVIEAGRRGGVEASHLALILRALRSWNLVLADGSPRPLDVTEVGLLDTATVQWLLDALDDAWFEEPLPNASSALSPDGSSESATSTPTPPSTTETPPTSTTT